MSDCILESRLFLFICTMYAGQEFSIRSYLRSSGRNEDCSRSLSITDLHTTELDKSKRAVKQLAKLKPDFIIVDGAAGLGREALHAIPSVEELLIVTNPEMPAIADALKTTKLAEKFDRKVTGIVLQKQWTIILTYLQRK